MNRSIKYKIIFIFLNVVQGQILSSSFLRFLTYLMFNKLIFFIWRNTNYHRLRCFLSFYVLDPSINKSSKHEQNNAIYGDYEDSKEEIFKKYPSVAKFFKNLKSEPRYKGKHVALTRQEFGKLHSSMVQLWRPRRDEVEID